MANLKLTTLAALNRLTENHGFDVGACAAKVLVGHFNGIEFGLTSFELATGKRCYYVNTGDTYSWTLAYYKDAWVESSWGDLYEESEKERYEATGEQRCCHCGEFAEIEDEEGYCPSCCEKLG